MIALDIIPTMHTKKVAGMHKCIVTEIIVLKKIIKTYDIIYKFLLRFSCIY